MRFGSFTARSHGSIPFLLMACLTACAAAAPRTCDYDAAAFCLDLPDALPGELADELAGGPALSVARDRGPDFDVDLATRGDVFLLGI